MTTRARPLTEDATSPPNATAAPWTIRAADARSLLFGLERLGYRRDLLLSACGLDASDLEDADARVACTVPEALVRSAQQQRFTPNIALAMARVTPVGSYPLLDYLILTTATVADGIHQLARYFRLVASPIVFDVHDEGQVVRVEIRSDSPFSVEYSAALMAFHFRAETEDRFRLSKVSLQHAPDDACAFEQTLDCQVQANAPWNGVIIARESWELPLRRHDAVLRQLLEQQADGILARLPSRTGLAHRVQRWLITRVAGGDTSIESLGRELAMSPRTLQRRLSEEGATFQELLDDTRREAAARYLDDGTLSIGEVAYLLGFSEPAPFHRAFKRWYGVTPSAYRRKLSSGRVRGQTS